MVFEVSRRDFGVGGCQARSGACVVGTWLVEVVARVGVLGGIWLDSISWL